MPFLITEWKIIRWSERGKILRHAHNKQIEVALVPFQANRCEVWPLQNSFEQRRSDGLDHLPVRAKFHVALP